jgi:hypothetical protein
MTQGEMGKTPVAGRTAFLDGLYRFGPRPERWPAKARADAEAFLPTEAARDELRRAEKRDRLLADAMAVPAPPQLSARIIQHVAQRRLEQDRGSRFVEWFGVPRRMVSAGAVAAVLFLACGAWIGTMHESSIDDDSVDLVGALAQLDQGSDEEP